MQLMRFIVSGALGLGLAVGGCSDDDGTPSSDVTDVADDTAGDVEDMEDDTTDVADDVPPDDVADDATDDVTNDVADDTVVLRSEPLTLVATLDGELADEVPEHGGTLSLVATWSGTPGVHAWRQTGGPTVGLTDEGPHRASVDLSGLEVAAPTRLVFTIEPGGSGGSGGSGSGGSSGSGGTSGSWPSVGVTVTPVDRISALGEGQQLGGSTSAVATFGHAGARWVAFGVGNRLTLAPLGLVRGVETRLIVPGAIRDLRVFETSVAGVARRFALMAMGTAGVGVVEVTDPTSPQHVDSARLDHFRDGIVYTDGGGTIQTDGVLQTDQAEVSCVETDGTTAWIGDAGWGIKALPLESLLGPMPRKANGTLATVAERYTLHHAGETGWGGPLQIRHVRGRLFVAQGFLGLGIYDGATLERVGGYNLYTDADVVEDWFIGMDVRDAVARDPETGEPFLDPDTGMPDPRQVSFEIDEVWHGAQSAPTPWVEFERYGRYYYMARGVDVASWETGGGMGMGSSSSTRDIAYIAYGLGGLVAVDVSGFDAARGHSPVRVEWLGYAPAVPPHGPEMPTVEDAESEGSGSGGSGSGGSGSGGSGSGGSGGGGGSGSGNGGFFSHSGWGRLKDAGVGSVAVRGGQVWFADHFGGLVVMEGADDPRGRWHGQRGAGEYDNDSVGTLGDHAPNYEFVTSYDMGAWDAENDSSLPRWMYEAPVLLTTGEVIGHGGAISLEPSMTTSASGPPDLAQAGGSGGLALFDIRSLTTGAYADRFSLVAQHVSLDVLGAASDGTASAPMNLGHTQGVAGSGRFIYVADGPHGVSAWQVADDLGNPLDPPTLVGNSLQGESSATVDGVTIYPMPNAAGVIYDPSTQSVLSMSMNFGVRRASVSAIEAGQGSEDAPLLIAPLGQDFFEHTTESGQVGGIVAQDFATDAKVEGTLAFVADGRNGLTVYDLSKNPAVPGSGFIAGNLGGTTGEKPGLGRATGIELWRDSRSGKRYAFVAAGASGLGVVDATTPADMRYVKVFPPIKVESDGPVGKADGRSVDVRVVGDTVWLSYSTFGIVAYAIEDLIAPLPDGVDPLAIWSRGGDGGTYDHRPVALGQLKLSDIAGYANVPWEFLGFDAIVAGRTVELYVGAGEAGLAALDASDPRAPRLLGVASTSGSATAVHVMNGRVYVADDGGGLAVFR